MCEYCGCRGVPPIGELMDEHTALMDQANEVRADLAAGNPPTAMARLKRLVARLDRHVQREEDGVFLAMRTAGEFLDELDALEGEHRNLAASLETLDPSSADFVALVTRLLDDLEAHVEREDLGIFPVSVVSLGAVGWAIVNEAHTRSPSFLHDETTTSTTPS